MTDVEFFDGETRSFGEEVGKIGVVIAELLAYIEGKIDDQRFFGLMDLLDNDIFYLLNKNIFFVFYQLKMRL